jgi:hypothetical protein
MFDGIFRGGGYLEIFGVEEAGFRWGLIDRELMLNEALLEGSDVRSMVSQQHVLDNVFSPLFLANRVTADRLLPIVVENIRWRRMSVFCAVLISCTRADLPPSTIIVSTSRYTSSWCVFAWSARRPATRPCTTSFSTTSLRHRGSLRACFCKVTCRKLRFITLNRVFIFVAVDQSYPGATQLALDMLLKVDAHEELIMVLLQRKQIIAALKYVREHNIIAPAASFLKAAKATGDDGAPSPSLLPCLMPNAVTHSHDFQPSFLQPSSTSSLWENHGLWRLSLSTMCAAS